jgi:low affinity Fe/Cu permease
MSLHKLHDKMMLFGVAIKDLQNDLKQMRDKGLPVAMTADREQLINNLIDYYSDSQDVIEKLEHIVSLQQAQLKIITLAHKQKQTNENRENKL